MVVKVNGSSAGRWFRVAAPFAVAGVLGWGSGASAQVQASAKAMPDAQVEANVLKGLAGAKDLANQSITTTTVYGVVTLSGSVETEAMRTEAETIASRTAGVQKVVDELTLGNGSGSAAQNENGGGSSLAAATSGQVLQSDGTMAPAQGSPDSDNTAPQAQPQQAPQQQAGNSVQPQPQPSYGPGAPEYRPAYPSQPQPGYPQQQPGYGPPQQQAYQAAPQQPYGYGGQQAGEMVTIPSGALIRMRINQTLDSSRTQPGATFDGVVVSDVVAGGAVAIPRGATVHGTVVDAKKSGAISGRGELSLQLTQLTLGGKTYALTSDVWSHNGADKTIQTVNSTAIGGGVGALVGAAAGGGAGAAIGAGVGGLLGLGSSAASHSGQVYVPSEGLLTFHIQQPVTVATVSQAEMDRLAQGIGPAGQPRPLVRRYPYPAPYYGPVYYRPYYPYPY